MTGTCFEVRMKNDGESENGPDCAMRNKLEIIRFIGHYGIKDGAVVRALVSHQCGPGSFPAWCHIMDVG